MPEEKVFVLEDKYNGATVEDNYEKVNKKLAKAVDVLLVSTLDDIAWFLNLRGNDIEFNPVFFAYLLYHVPQNEGEKGHVQLFINKDKVSDESVQKHLTQYRVEVLDYSQIFETLKQHAEQKKRIGLDENEINYRLYEIIKDATTVQKEGTLEHIKALKTKAQ